MMKNSWITYGVYLAATAVVVASTVFLPSVLLQRKESAMLGEEKTLINGSYQSRQYPKPAFTQPAGTPDAAGTADPNTAPDDGSGPSMSKIIAKILLLNDRNSVYTMPPSGPSDEKTGMKEAVDSCIRSLLKYIWMEAILPLPEFAKAYDVNASLQTVTDDAGREQSSFWDISFNSSPKLIDKEGTIAVVMEAETGIILMMKMHINTAVPFDLNRAAAAFAEDLDIDGVAVEVQHEDRLAETVVWAAKDKSLFIIFNLNRSKASTGLSIYFDTKMPQR